jgi:hypothetical protein
MSRPLTEREIEIQVILPGAVKRLLNGDAETPTDAVEGATRRDLDPGVRADVATYAQFAAEKIEQRRADE